MADVAKAALPAAPDGVQFVDEYDRGRGALRLFEEVAHTAGTHAYKDLDELRGVDVEEGDASLARDGACHEGLAGPGRTHEEHAAGNARAHVVILAREAQEVSHFLQVAFGLVCAGDIVKRHLGAGAGLAARGAAGKVHDLVLPLDAGGPAWAQQRVDEETQRHQVDEKQTEPGAGRLGYLDAHALALQEGHEFRIPDGGRENGLEARRDAALRAARPHRRVHTQVGERD